MTKWTKLGYVGAILNSLDAFFTTFFVMKGLAIELNPFMSVLLNISPILFIAFKLCISPIYVVIGNNAKTFWSKVFFSGVLTVYSCIIIYYLIHFFLYAELFQYNI